MLVTERNQAFSEAVRSRQRILPMYGMRPYFRCVGTGISGTVTRSTVCSQQKNVYAINMAVPEIYVR